MTQTIRVPVDDRHGRRLRGLHGILTALARPMRTMRVPRMPRVRRAPRSFAPKPTEHTTAAAASLLTGR